jgi:hypothetical protein
MKSFSLSFFFCLSLLSLTPFQTAQAGIVIGALSGDALRGAAIGAVLGGGVGTALTIQGAIQADPNSSEVITMWAYLTAMGGIAGAVLDVDAALPTDELITGFKKAMPYIDNNECFEKLANLTKERFKIQLALTPDAEQVLVRLNRAELADALGSADISQEQFESVVRIFE